MTKLINNDVPIRDAATIVLIRKENNLTKVLMGQRGRNAAFMPSKFVFPGGAYDQEDSKAVFSQPLSVMNIKLLKLKSDPKVSEGLAATVIRELWEESGLKMGKPSIWTNAPVKGWEDFQKENLGPDASGLTFFFRAITPAGRPRRFDARFFMCSANTIDKGLDDFSQASAELSHLHWIEIEQAQNLDLPVITRVVLKEVFDILKAGPNKRGIPFYNKGSSLSDFSYLTLNS